MPSTKEIKQKIKSTGNIKKIAKTMEMVSVSKMRRAVDKALSSRAYARLSLELLVNLSKDMDIEHPLMLAPQKAGKAGKEAQGELLIVVAGNKGLCGGYHTNLTRSLNLYFKKKNGETIKAITVGKYAEKICRKLGVPIVASFINFSEYSTTEEVKILSDLAKREFVENNYASAKILYTEFLKSTTYKPSLRELFPISVNSVKNALEPAGITVQADEKRFLSYVFEPSASEVIENILPGLVDVVIHQTLSESFASEHSARMFAMKNAGDNATTILDALMLSYNHARQDGITRELSEIVAGAEALNAN
jgi:F-type H+-transporting ATPase subunit gamma